MGVVRQHEGNACFPADADQSGRGAFFFRYTVILYLKIKTVFPEEFTQFKRFALCLVVISAQNILRYITPYTSGKADQTFAVLFQQFPVDSWLDVKPFGKGNAYQPAEIVIPCFIAAEQDEMRIVSVPRLFLVMSRTRCNIDFAADDWLNTGCFAGFVKSHRPVHDSVVRNGKRRHAKLGCPFCNLVDAAGSVEQGKFCMHMEVNKTHSFSSFTRSAIFFSR